MPDQSNINTIPQKMPEQNAKPSKEDQALVDMFLINGMEMIYDDKASKAMLARIGANEDPTKAIAEFLVDIVIRIVKSAKGAGKDISPGVVLHGSNFLLGEIFKVLEAAGMEPLTEEQATGVWQMATSIYLDKAVQSGLMTEQELMTYSEQIKQTEVGQKIVKAEGQAGGQIGRQAGRQAGGQIGGQGQAGRQGQTAPTAPAAPTAPTAPAMPAGSAMPIAAPQGGI